MQTLSQSPKDWTCWSKSRNVDHSYRRCQALARYNNGDRRRGWNSLSGAMDTWVTVTLSEVVVNSGIREATGPLSMRACVKSSTDGSTYSVITIQYRGTPNVVGSSP